jgi:hypothetical protein
MKIYVKDGKIIVDGEGESFDLDTNDINEWILKHVEKRNFHFEGKFANVSMSTRIKDNASEYV